MTTFAEALGDAGFERGLPPLPPEATRGDGPVPVTSYNHRCNYGGWCPTWVPNHHERCVPHRAQPLTPTTTEDP